MKNGDMPAMPVTDDVGMPFNSVPEDLCTMGLTKREMMAMHIIQGFAADPDVSAPANKVAELAVNWTDNLLAELERTKSS